MYITLTPSYVCVRVRVRVCVCVCVKVRLSLSTSRRHLKGAISQFHSLIPALDGVEWSLSRFTQDKTRLFIIIGIQPLGRSGQRPEVSQATGMALVRCILGKFLGVACHCFPPLFRCSHFSPPGASTSATT